MIEKTNQPWQSNIATFLSNHVFYFYHQTVLRQTCYLSIDTIMLSTNCQRDNRYIGRMSQRLQESIKQHNPKSAKNVFALQSHGKSFSPLQSDSIFQCRSFHESSIGQNLIDNSQFPLVTATTDSLFVFQVVLLFTFLV